MRNIASTKTTLLLVLGLLPAAVAAPASANWFSADPKPDCGDTLVQRPIRLLRTYVPIAQNALPIRPTQGTAP